MAKIHGASLSSLVPTSAFFARPARLVRNWLSRSSGILILLLLWQLLTMWAQSFFFPTPIQVTIYEPQGD